MIKKSLLTIGLHSQSLNSPDGIVAGSEITTGGLMRAFLRDSRVADVKRYGPGNYANLPQDHLDLLVIEGWHKNVPEVINAVRCKNSECIILFWNLSFYGFDEIIRFDVDGYLTNSYKTLEYLSKIKPTIFLMLAAEPDEFFPTKITPEYAHDVVYLGINHPNKSEKILEMMLYEATKFNFALYGNHWGGQPVLAPFWKGQLPKNDIVKLYSSAKVVIGTTEDRQRAAGMINNRVFEALSCGACFVSEYFPELEAVFGDSILYSNNSGDTHQHIRRILSDVEFAATLRSKGRQRILQFHTYNHRAKELLTFYDRLCTERSEQSLSRNAPACQHLEQSVTSSNEHPCQSTQVKVRQQELPAQVSYGPVENSCPFLSIIVPVYNAEPYLALFLQNVLAQTFIDFELILVDDKSTDTSLSILEQYKQLDSRIRVVALEKNAGASVARNKGIDHAKGLYVRFIDCDDLLPQDSFGLLCNAAMAYGSDVVKGYLYSYDLTSGRVAENHWGGRSYAQEQKINQPLRDLPELWNLYDHHSMIVRRSLLQNFNISYPVLKNFQDPPMMAQVLSAAATISLIPHNVYLYVSGRNVQSILRSRWTFENYEALLHGYEIMLRHLSEKGLTQVVAYKISTFARDWFAKLLLMHDWQTSDRMHALFRQMDSIVSNYHVQLFQPHDPPYIRIFFTLLAAKRDTEAHFFLHQLVIHNNANRLQTLLIECPALVQHVHRVGGADSSSGFSVITAHIVSAMAALCVDVYDKVVLRLDFGEVMARYLPDRESFLLYLQLFKVLGGTLIVTMHGSRHALMSPHRAHLESVLPAVLELADSVTS